MEMALYRAPLKQVPMYPKHLVYSTEGNELQLEQLRAALPQYCYHPLQDAANDTCDMEMTTTCPGNITQLVPVAQSSEKEKVLVEKKALNEFHAEEEIKGADIVEEELQKVFGNPPSPVLPPSPPVDLIEKEMELLMKEREKEKSGNDRYVHEWDITQKENLPIVSASKPPFHFTPSVCDTLPSDSWHATSLMATKLSFSEADHTHSLLQCFQGEQNRSLKSHLPCERKLLLSDEQQKFEDEFVNGYTEIQVLHENKSKMERKPLGELEGEASHANADVSNSDSFSVYEDPSQASIHVDLSTSRLHIRPVHYHLVPDASKPHRDQPLPHSYTNPGSTDQHALHSCTLSGSAAARVTTANTTVTEFDIVQHACFEPTSTPFKQTLPNLNMLDDITAITMLHEPQTNDTCINPPAPPQVAPPPLLSSHMPPLPHHRILDTITEESHSSYGSTSSSSSTTTGNYSVSSLSCQTTDNGELQDLISNGVFGPDGAVNPFSHECVQFMLRSLSITATRIFSSENGCQRIASGGKLTLQSDNYIQLCLVAKGGFASVYSALDSSGTKKALKVQSPPYLWEVAIIEELHRRLKANNLLMMVECFMSVECCEMFTNTSIIISQYYQYGTLLDVINFKGRLPEVLVSYYVAELLLLVEHLHLCGIIHGDIKPDNLMLRDISNLTQHEARGHGVCLIDFGRAIDVCAFPPAIQFTGSSCTDGFQCREMLVNQSWKWQLDYHCIAATVYLLLHKKYFKFSSGNTYTLPNPPRSYDRQLWLHLLNNLLTPSLHWGSTSFLSTLRQPVDAFLAKQQQGFQLSWSCVKDRVKTL